MTSISTRIARFLLHCHAFRQISRLIDRSALRSRHVVGEQLKVDVRHQRFEFAELGHLEGLIEELLRAVHRGEANDWRPP